MLSALALTVTLASSFGWAAFDVARKLAVRRVDARALLAVMSVAQAPIFLLAAAFGAPVFVRPSYAAAGIASVLLNSAASLLYLESVRLSPLSMTIPLLGLTPALSMLAGALLVGELPDTSRGVGIVLVVAGALVLHARRSDLARPWRLFVAIGRERGSLYMALVAVFWSVSPAVDKLALRHASVAAHAAIQVAGVAVVMLAVLVLRGELHLVRQGLRARGVVAAAVVSGAFALATQLIALRLVLVSVFEAVKRGVGMTLSVVSGRLWFSEPVTAPKLVAVVAMSVGIALLVQR